MNKIYTLLFLCCIGPLLFAQNQLYKVQLLRAKPGELLNLIETVKKRHHQPR